LVIQIVVTGNKLAHSLIQGKQMRRIALLASILFLAACARTDKTPDHDLVGRYYLQGIMEMGSQLALQNDGKFEAVIEYGSADGYAKGFWTLEGRQLRLHRQSPAVSVESDISQFFDGMTLTVSDNCLAIEGSTGCYFKVPK
jgi:outer membrane biogenesis lipoprotein LolB